MPIYQYIRTSDFFDWFQGPYFENGKNHLQKVVGDDNILVVKFPEMPSHTNVGDTYDQVAEEGIVLGLRRYRFLSKLPLRM